MVGDADQAPQDEPPGLPHMSDADGRPIRLARIATRAKVGEMADLIASLSAEGIECFTVEHGPRPWVAEPAAARAMLLLREPREVLAAQPICPRCGPCETDIPRFSKIAFIGSVLLFMWWSAWNQLRPKWTCDACGQRWTDHRGFVPLPPRSA